MRYSNAESFNKCPYKYHLQNNLELKAIFSPTHDNALICGTAIHLGAEMGRTEEAINYYYSNFSITSDLHENEVIKLEHWIPKLVNLIDKIGQEQIHEIKFNFGKFFGTADLLIKNQDGTYDLYDFKYSNNIENYCKSKQLHVYRYFLERLGYKINKMAFIFIPKTFVRQKKTETVETFRTRLKGELEKLSIKIEYIEYNVDNVIDILLDGITALETENYTKNPTKLCDWCDFKRLCLEEDDIDMLPSSKRRELTEVSYKKNWFYGLPFTGKTTLADKYPNPILLNTDGNYKLLTTPTIYIKDEVTVSGRIINKKFAWEIFKNAISELEKGQHDFKTVIVDLLEDTKEMARLYMYDKLGIEHESDNSFKAWDMIRNEWLNTMKRLVALEMNVVFISHEDTSKDITKKSGDKITAIKPNLSDKESLKISGMMDWCARVVNDNGDRYITFKSSECEFGGGRLNVKIGEKLPLTYESIEKIYSQHNGQAVIETATIDEEEKETADIKRVRKKKGE